MTGTPRPGLNSWLRRVNRVEVVVMIDEFAPIVEAKVHVASLYAFGVARAARQGEGWIVEIEIQLGMWTSSVSVTPGRSTRDCSTRCRPTARA